MMPFKMDCQEAEIMKKLSNIAMIFVLIAMLMGCSSKEKAELRQIQKLQEEGTMAMGNRDFKTAEEKFLKILEIDPDQQSIKNNLAVIYARYMDRPEDAKRLWTELLEKTPHSSAFLNNLASVYLSEKNYDKAIELYESAKKYHNSYHLPYYNIGQILIEQGKYNKAVEELEQCLKLAQNDSAANAAYGRALNIAGETDKALSFFKDIFQKIPNSPQIALAYIRLLKRVGDYNTAQEIITKQLEMPQDQIRFVMERIELAFLEDRSKEEVEALMAEFSQLKKASEFQWYADFVNARLKAMDANAEEALKIIKSLDNTIPENEKYYEGIRQHNLAEIYKKIGDMDNAEIANQLAEKNAPEIYPYPISSDAEEKQS